MQYEQHAELRPLGIGALRKGFPNKNLLGDEALIAMAELLVAQDSHGAPGLLRAIENKQWEAVKQYEKLLGKYGKAVGKKLVTLFMPDQLQQILSSDYPHTVTIREKFKFWQSVA
jgi:hypothetical protein